MTTVPVHLLAHLMHAFLQKVADDNGVDLLHVKGPALHDELLQRGPDGPLPRHSTDADVMVRPADAERFLRCLVEAGGEQRSGFDTGSPFDHAANIWSDHLGHADVHRFFPGIDMRPDRAFESMWERRDYRMIGAQPCATPNLEDQRLIVLLHAARSGGERQADKVRAWDDASDEVRASLLARAEHLQARVGLSAALGSLDEHRAHPSYLLWDQFSRHPEHTRTEEWIARWSAARTPRERLSVLRRAFRVNTDRLAMDLGRQPTPAEVRAATRLRYRRALGETLDRVLRSSS